MPTAVSTAAPTATNPSSLKLRGGAIQKLSPEALASLEQDGFAVIKGAIPLERANKYASDMYSWMESFGLGFDRNDIPGTSKPEQLPFGYPNGLRHNYGVAHEQFVWDIRTEPGVVDAFAEVYGTEQLIVSYDGVNATFPGVTYDAWPHQDQDPLKHGFRCLQGIVNLLPNGPNDGGLIVCKGTHNSSQEYHEYVKNDPKKEFWTTEWYGYSEKGLKWLEERGHKWEKVCAGPGDLIIWDSRTAHYNVPPTSDSPRLATYVCMLPAEQATAEEIAKKQKAFAEQKCTTHWPLAAMVHDGFAERTPGVRDPQDTGKPRQKPVLDERGLKLAGVVPY